MIRSSLLTRSRRPGNARALPPNRKVPSMLSKLATILSSLSELPILPLLEGDGKGAVRVLRTTTPFVRSRACRWCFLLLFLLAPLTLRAEDINIEAKLIWGTNSDKAPEPVIPEVDKPTADKLQNVFKWKHYFLCNKQNAFIPSRGTRQIVLS